jgi:hypothetical protein
MTDGFASIIDQLERQKAAIERALAALREVEGTATAAPASREPATRNATSSGRRNRRSEAQKKRWAAKKAAETAPSAKAAPRKVRLTPEGRERLAEAMKRRWAVKRAASAVKKAGRKQRATKKAA